MLDAEELGAAVHRKRNFVAGWLRQGLTRIASFDGSKKAMIRPRFSDADMFFVLDGVYGLDDNKLGTGAKQVRLQYFKDTLADKVAKGTVDRDSGYGCDIGQDPWTRYRAGAVLPTSFRHTDYFSLIQNRLMEGLEYFGTSALALKSLAQACARDNPNGGGRLFSADRIFWCPFEAFVLGLLKSECVSLIGN